MQLTSNFPSEIAWEMQKISKKTGKKIYGMVCVCGQISLKATNDFTEEEKTYCAKCNPKPISFRTKMVSLIILVSIAIIIS